MVSLSGDRREGGLVASLPHSEGNRYYFTTLLGVLLGVESIG